MLLFKKKMAKKPKNPQRVLPQDRMNQVDEEAVLRNKLKDIADGK